MTNRKTSRLEAGLFRDRVFGRALWLALALIVFLTAGGNAQEVSKAPPKTAKPANYFKPVRLPAKAVKPEKASRTALAEKIVGRGRRRH